jgi:hypothetical protein
MSSAIELIIDFKDPGINVQIVSNQLGQLLNKISLSVNVISSDGNWNVSLLENSFGA